MFFDSEPALFTWHYVGGDGWELDSECKDHYISGKVFLVSFDHFGAKLFFDRQIFTEFGFKNQAHAKQWVVEKLKDKMKFFS
jgi:hypothetical protein